MGQGRLVIKPQITVLTTLFYYLYFSLSSSTELRGKTARQEILSEKREESMSRPSPSRNNKNSRQGEDFPRNCLQS